MNPEQLIIPGSTSEFYALMKMLRDHDGQINDALRTIAVGLKSALPHATGANFVAIRADLHINARRVTRHIEHAAASHLAAGTAMTKAYTTYLELFTKQSKHTGRKVFDIDG
jgi:hypothetical protein